MPRLRLLIAFLIVLNIFALLVLWSGGTSTSAGEPERLNNQLNPDQLTLVAPAQECARYGGFSRAQADALTRQLRLQLPHLDVRRTSAEGQEPVVLELRSSAAILEVIARSLGRQNIQPHGVCAPNAASDPAAVGPLPPNRERTGNNNTGGKRK
ncbi:MAG: hypothetical protein J6T92_04555 [Ottowia sp.]|nr:hypothetical protein [Ottowia sp.]